MTRRCARRRLPVLALMAVLVLTALPQAVAVQGTGDDQGDLGAGTVAPEDEMSKGPSGSGQDHEDRDGGVGDGPGEDGPSRTGTLKRSFEYSTPELREIESGGYIVESGDLPGSRDPGRPVLPVEQVTVTLPPGTEVLEVNARSEGAEIISIDGEPVTSPDTVPLPCMNGDGNEMRVRGTGPEAGSQTTEDIHPGTLSSYDLSFGLTPDRGEERGFIPFSGSTRSLFVDIELHPVQYDPSGPSLLFHRHLELEVTFVTEGVEDGAGEGDRAGAGPGPLDAEYDMVIITTQTFEEAYERLAHHRNTTFVTTRVVTLQDIYNGKYFTVNGTDNGDRIKHFIRDAIENWGIRYVLLGGDSTEVPARTAYIIWPFITDLYYADIYEEDGSFARWEADDDGMWGEFSDDRTEIDIRPDVHLGRLPSSSLAQAEGMVDKVINYDNTTVGEDWFKQATFISNMSSGVNYAEYLEDNVYQEEKGWSHIELHYQKSTVQNFLAPQNHSVGVMTFWGHGGETRWLGATYITRADVYAMNNSDRLPVVTIMACNCGNFAHGSDCFAESFLKNVNGGAISVLAGTQTSNGASHDDRSGAINRYFHDANADNSTRRIGMMYSKAVNMYYEKENPSGNSLDYKNLLEYVLFADPATTMGGFSRTHASMSTDDMEQGGLPGRTVGYNLTVDNTGNGYADIHLEVEQDNGSSIPPEWTVEFPENITVDGGESLVVQVNVTIPQEADANQTLGMLIRGTSINFPESPLEITTETTAMTNYTFTFEAGDTSLEVEPGGNVTYSLELGNTGNDVFGFDVEMVGEHEGWTVDLPDTHVILQDQETTGIDLELGPTGELVSGYYPMTVRCTLKGGGRVAEVELNTTLLQAHGFELITNNTRVEAVQGQELELVLTAENLGNHFDTLGLAFPTEALLVGWDITCGEGAAMDLQAFGTREFGVNVTVPEMEIAGSYTVAVNATLMSDGSSQQVDFEISVLAARDFVLSVDAHRAEVSPPGSAHFEIRIENRGNIHEDLYLEVLDLPSDWDYAMVEFISIEPYGMGLVDLDVTIAKEDVLGGPYNFTVTATSQGSDNPSSLGLAIDVPETFGMVASCVDDRKSVMPGENGTFSLLIENTGNTHDVFDLKAVDLPMSLEVMLPDDGTGVDAWGSMTIEIEVGVSQDARAGMETFGIEVISRGDEGMGGELEMVVEILPVRAMELEARDPTNLEVKAGEQAIFGFSLINRGNDDDSFDIGIEDTPDRWTISTKDIIDLEAGESHAGQVTITVPEDAEGEEVVLTLMVTSQGDDGVEEELVLTLDVKEKRTVEGGEGDMTTIIALVLVVVVVCIVLAFLFLKRMGGKGEDMPVSEQPPPVAPEGQQPPSEMIEQTPGEEEAGPDTPVR